jgi:hypothetical protein
MAPEMTQWGVSRVLFLGKYYLGDEKQKNLKRAGHVLRKEECTQDFG